NLSMSSDGIEYYAYVRSVAVDGDIEFTNEFDPDVPFRFVPTWLIHNETPTGYSRNLASVGPAVVWAPFYLAGDGLARLGRLLGTGWETDGYTRPYIMMINLAGVVALVLTAWLCYLSVRAYVSRRSALLASLALAAGSGIVYFGLLKSDFPH